MRRPNHFRITFNEDLRTNTSKIFSWRVLGWWMTPHNPAWQLQCCKRGISNYQTSNNQRRSVKPRLQCSIYFRKITFNVNEVTFSLFHNHIVRASDFPPIFSSRHLISSHFSTLCSSGSSRLKGFLTECRDHIANFRDYYANIGD